MPTFSKKPIKFGNILCNVAEDESIRVISTRNHIDLQATALSWETNTNYSRFLALECNGITAKNGVMTVYL